MYNILNVMSHPAIKRSNLFRMHKPAVIKIVVHMGNIYGKWVWDEYYGISPWYEKK